MRRLAPVFFFCTQALLFAALTASASNSNAGSTAPPGNS